MSSDFRIVVWSTVGFFAGLYFFRQGFIWRKELQLVEGTPTSKVRSIAMGQVEVVGKAACWKKPVISPFSNTECAYFRITVEEYRSSGKSGRWVTVNEESSTTPFCLADDTGKVLVHPEGADIDLPQSYECTSSWGKDPDKYVMKYLEKNKISFEGLLGANKSMRYREYVLQEGQSVYVLGYAGKNPHVRSSARNEETVMLQKGPADQTYMISVKSEKELISLLRWKVIGGWVGGGALAVFCLLVIFAFFNIL